MANEIRAMMPGIVSQLLVKAGDAFEAGAVVAILETMKMENPVEADAAGRVERIWVAEGDAVEEDGVILTFI